MAELEKEPRQSTITVGITRTLNTAQFENLQIKVETTEQIKWTDMKDRVSKIDKITSVVIDQYQRSQEEVLKELGVTPKAAWFKSK